MRSQKRILLVVVMMILVALGVFCEGRAWALSPCGVCKKDTSWTQISDCPTCGYGRWRCDGCGGCYHVCKDTGGDGGGDSGGESEPDKIIEISSLTAVNNENSVTLNATVRTNWVAFWYCWSTLTVTDRIGKEVDDLFQQATYYETPASSDTLTLSKEVSEAATWNFYLFTRNGPSGVILADRDIQVYSITYNANNGSSAPATQYKAHGYNLTLTSSVPTREGYTFLGWSTSSTATNATYIAGSNFTGNSNTTLYAVWERSIIPIDTATVTLSPSQYTYDGTEHTPAVNVVVEDKILILGTEYTVNYIDNKNAGTATVTITGVGDYTGTVNKTFIIKKKSITVNWSPKNQFIYSGTQRMPTATVESGIENESIILSVTPNPAGSIEAGSYVATATIASVTNGLAANYIITNPTKAYEILDPSQDTEAPVATVEVVPVYTDSEGSRYVDKRAVTLKIRASDNITETQNLKIALLNESDRISAKNEDLVWEPFVETKSWQLSEGKGKKRVYIYVKDEAGNQSAYLD